MDDKKHNSVILFDGRQVRANWDEDLEEWFFSVVDVCNILSESKAKDEGAYWRKLKQ